MGVVRRQTIRNSIIQYLGIALGYYNSVWLFTRFLDMDQYGLTRVFMAISVLYVNFSSFGAPKMLIRFFPYFRTESKKHNGFLFFSASMCAVGFVFTTLIYLSLKGYITGHYAETTPLFTDNYYLIIVLAFLMLYSSILENFLIAMKRTVIPYFMKSIFIRLVWLAEIYMYHFGWFDFDTFMLFFVGTYLLNFLVMLAYLVYKGEFKVSFEFLNMRKRVFKVVVNYGLFSIVTGISNLIVNRIDIIMITFLLELNSTAVYSIAYYVSTVILVPSTALYRISMPVVAEQWKKKDMKEMLSLYRKSSINQILVGGLAFLVIWTNIDELYSFLPKDYANGKWIVFILSVSVLFNMSMGINNVIVMITKYFRYDTFASITLGILTVVTNLIFIPIMGLEGAALATLISVVSYQTYKYILLIVKFRMQPFTFKTILAVLLMAGIYFGSTLLPEISNNPVILIAYRSIIIALVFIPLIRLLNISEDLSREIDKYLGLIGLRKSS